jgi:hypothetical protein
MVPTMLSVMVRISDLTQPSRDFRFVAISRVMRRSKKRIVNSIALSVIASIARMKRTSGLAIDNQFKLCRLQHGNILDVSYEAGPTKLVRVSRRSESERAAAFRPRPQIKPKAKPKRYRSNGGIAS